MASDFLAETAGPMRDLDTQKHAQDQDRSPPRRQWIRQQLEDIDISLWTIDCSLDNSYNSKGLCPFVTKQYGLCDFAFDTDSNMVDDLKGNKDEERGILLTPSASSTYTTSPQTDQSSRLLDQISIPFDYEVYYTKVDKPPLDFVQGYLLHLLALELGLKDCSSLETRWRILTTEDQVSSSYLPPSWEVLALTYAGEDVVVNQPCQAPVENDIRDIATCRKIQGQVTTYFNRSRYSDADESAHGDADDQAKLAVTSQVLKEIRSVMIQNRLVVSTPTGSVDRVIFMGQRGSFSDLDLNPNSSQGPDDRALDSVIGIVSLVLLALPVAALIGLRRQMRKRQSQKDPITRATISDDETEKKQTKYLGHSPQTSGETNMFDLESSWPLSGSGDGDNSSQSGGSSSQNCGVEIEAMSTPSRDARSSQGKESFLSAMLVNVIASDQQVDAETLTLDEEDWMVRSEGTKEAEEEEVVFYSISRVGNPENGNCNVDSSSIANREFLTNTAPSTTAQTLAFLSEPSLLISWVHDEDDDTHDGPPL